MRTVQSWTCKLGYGADTMFHSTYFLFGKTTPGGKIFKILFPKFSPNSR